MIIYGQREIVFFVELHPYSSGVVNKLLLRREGLSPVYLRKTQIAKHLMGLSYPPYF